VQRGVDMLSQRMLDLKFSTVPEPVFFPVGKRISAGVKFLNDLEPDWRSRINEAGLDIGCSISCILGQLFGDYMNGCAELRLDPRKEAAEMGFNVLDSESSTTDREFVALTRGWRVALQNPSTRNLERLTIAA